MVSTTVASPRHLAAAAVTRGRRRQLLLQLLLTLSCTTPLAARRELQQPTVAEFDQARCLAALRSSESGCHDGSATALAAAGCDSCRVQAGMTAGCSQDAVRHFCTVVVPDAPINVTGIYPSMHLPVEGIVEVIVTLTPSIAGRTAAAAAATSGHQAAACRLLPYSKPGQQAGPGGCRPPDPNFLGTWPAVSFDNPRFATTVSARVLNATAIACTPPPVAVEGLAALSVSFDGVTFTEPWNVAPSLYTEGCKLQTCWLTRRPNNFMLPMCSA